LDDFHGGAEGRVWLACSQSGNVCVLKFRSDGNKDLLEIEAENWKKMYSAIFPPSKHVRTVKLAHNKTALVMPLLQKIKNFKDSNVKDAVTELMNYYLKMDMLPTDLNPHNIMLNQSPTNKKGLKALFVDIAKLEDNTTTARESFKYKINMILS